MADIILKDKPQKKKGRKNNTSQVIFTTDQIKYILLYIYI